ncbi:MAG TPA: OmpA family protein [Acetobacteraceae bacterium]|nr:OmpA family protein [Acetobacteraceae bacterium]
MMNPALPALLLFAAALPGVAAAQAPAPPAGLASLPGGAWRLAFAPDSPDLPPGAAPGLAALAGRLSAIPAGRVTVEAQASGPADDVSAARRLSLARARAVRDALVAAGLPATRVDVRALGRTEEALDAADVLPPGMPARTAR